MWLEAGVTITAAAAAAAPVREDDDGVDVESVAETLEDKEGRLYLILGVFFPLSFGVASDCDDWVTEVDVDADDEVDVDVDADLAVLVLLSWTPSAVDFATSKSCN